MNSRDEQLLLTKSDYRRFVAAVTGLEPPDLDAHPLLTAFLPFAMPTWRLVGGGQLPADGANRDAIPGLSAPEGGVVALGQDLVFHQPCGRYEPLRRRSQVVADEQKRGRSGQFRLLTVDRETAAGRGTLVSQTERFAIRGRA